MRQAPLPPPPSPWVLRLGFAGLIPFVLGCVLVWQADSHVAPWATLALAGYAATIASFLGGIHWGLAMRGGPNTNLFPYVWGVVPSVVAWAAVILPLSAGLWVLGCLLVACYAVDHKLYPHYALQRWLPLRLRLTLVAVLSCWLGAWGARGAN